MSSDFASSIARACSFWCDGASLSHASAAPGCCANAASSTAGGSTVRGAVSCSSVISTSSPPPRPVFARVSALNEILYFPPIDEIVLR